MNDTDAGGGGSAAGASGAGGSGAGSIADPLQDIYGGFKIAFVPANGTTAAHTTLSGQLKDAPEATADGWSETMKSGDCTLYEPKAPFCDPGCGGTAVCVRDGVCQPYPGALTIGRLHLVGLGPSELVLDPGAKNYSLPTGATLPYPPCTEGEAITLRSDAYVAYGFDASCIAVLEVPGTIHVEAGQATKVTWSKPGDAAAARIEMKLDISHHGGSRGKIECVTDDDGELEIAASLISKLIDLGVSGAPSLSVNRVMAGKTTSGDEAASRFELSSSVEKIVEIPGLVSCTRNEDCPDGETCQTDLKCAP